MPPVPALTPYEQQARFLARQPAFRIRIAGLELAPPRPPLHGARALDRIGDAASSAARAIRILASTFVRVPDLEPEAKADDDARDPSGDPEGGR
jgi:hypothetical protein